MIGIIGGTGLTELPGLSELDARWIETPYGEPSAALNTGRWNNQDVVFLARHGNPHQIPPHLVNYRANLWALRHAGVKDIIAVNAVGGIDKRLGPAHIAIPDQIIDYTWGREQTLFDGSVPLDHIDCTEPYSETLRKHLLSAAKAQKITVLERGVYGATQGPRLETAAEIRRFQHDGCDMVGMTGMPEASLARELGMNYASIALSVNWAAGLTDHSITMADIQLALEKGMGDVLKIIEAFLAGRDH